jgi:exopolysaccharide biosynthesis polyprenyl glycosylphosphotransferase
VTEASLSAEPLARPELFEAPVRRAWTGPAAGTPVFHPDAAEKSRTRGRRLRPDFFLEIRRAGDTAVALGVIAFMLMASKSGLTPAGASLSWGAIALLAAVAVTWRLVFSVVGMYEEGGPASLREEAPSVAAACTFGVLLLLPLAVLAGDGMAWALILGLPLLATATLGGRYVVRRVGERAGTRSSHRVLIVGSGPLALGLHRRLQADPTSGYELVGFVDSAPHIRFGVVGERYIGALTDLDAILMNTVVDEVLIALPIKSHYDEVQRSIQICEKAGIQARYSADIFQASLGGLRYKPSGSQPAISVQVVADDYRISVKRAIDILGAGFGLVAISPLLAVIALAVKLSSPGPVFYGQERFGWRKRRFKMMKFRTMVAGAEALQAELEARNEATGPVFKIRDDPRMTRVGRFLRATSLDELPQLWNVLRGEMSLVGPRPLPVRDVSRFDESWLMRRFSVVPGMTGLWQVSGRSDLGFSQWAELDLQYIDRWSLGLDLQILWRTFPAVLNGVGAR